MKRDDKRLNLSSGERRFLTTHAALHVLEWPLRIAAIAIPLWVVGGIIDSFAGEKTVVNLNFRFVFSVALSITLVGGVLAWKLRQQSRELRRCRERITKLESELEEPGKDLKS